jgi:hypothetical protein
MTEAHSQPEDPRSPYDTAAFQRVLRKVVDTPAQEVARGLAEQKAGRIR